MQFYNTCQEELSDKRWPTPGRGEWRRWFNFDANFDDSLFHPTRASSTATRTTSRRRKGKEEARKGRTRAKVKGQRRIKKRKMRRPDPNIASMNVDDDKRSEASVRTASTGDSSLMNEVTNFAEVYEDFE